MRTHPHQMPIVDLLTRLRVGDVAQPGDLLPLSRALANLGFEKSNGA